MCHENKNEAKEKHGLTACIGNFGVVKGMGKAGVKSERPAKRMVEEDQVNDSHGEFDLRYRQVQVASRIVHAFRQGEVL